MPGLGHLAHEEDPATAAAIIAAPPQACAEATPLRSLLTVSNVNPCLHRSRSARRGATDTRPHAAVIGSGLGGLAAAIRLGARGYRVTRVREAGPAGRPRLVFRQDGFTFDAGPTIITAPFILDELWSLAGANSPTT